VEGEARRFKAGDNPADSSVGLARTVELELATGLIRPLLLASGQI